jgi:hypothetical protein
MLLQNYRITKCAISVVEELNLRNVYFGVTEK